MISINIKYLETTLFLLFLVYEKHTDRIKEWIYTHPRCEK